MDTFSSIILASIVISSISLIGGVLLIWKELFTEKLSTYLVGFTAGVFIYIACSDLIPDLHQDFKKQKKWLTTIPFIAGIVLTYYLITLL